MIFQILCIAGIFLVVKDWWNSSDDTTVNNGDIPNQKIPLAAASNTSGKPICSYIQNVLAVKLPLMPEESMILYGEKGVATSLTRYCAIDPNDKRAQIEYASKDFDKIFTDHKSNFSDNRVFGQLIFSKLAKQMVELSSSNPINDDQPVGLLGSSIHLDATVAMFHLSQFLEEEAVKDKFMRYFSLYFFGLKVSDEVKGSLQAVNFIQQNLNITNFMTEISQPIDTKRIINTILFVSAVSKKGFKSTLTIVLDIIDDIDCLSDKSDVFSSTEKEYIKKKIIEPLIILFHNLAQNQHLSILYFLPKNETEYDLFRNLVVKPGESKAIPFETIGFRFHFDSLSNIDFSLPSFTFNFSSFPNFDFSLPSFSFNFSSFPNFAFSLPSFTFNFSSFPNFDFSLPSFSGMGQALSTVLIGVLVLVALLYSRILLHVLFGIGSLFFRLLNVFYIVVMIFQFLVTIVSAVANLLLSIFYFFVYLLKQIISFREIRVLVRMLVIGWLAGLAAQFFYEDIFLKYKEPFFTGCLYLLALYVLWLCIIVLYHVVRWAMKFIPTATQFLSVYYDTMGVELVKKIFHAPDDPATLRSISEYYDTKYFNLSLKVATSAENDSSVSSDARRDNCLIVGRAYLHGKGVAVNIYEAIKFFDKAKLLGSAEAFYELGMLYFEGTKITESMAKATEFFKVGSEKSHRECVFMYGHCLLSEQNSCANEDLGYEKMQAAAKMGHVRGQFMVGLAHLQGLGQVSKSATDAFTWFSKAAEAGDNEAMYNLGMLYLQGLGVVADRLAAIRWLEKAAEAGDTDAMYNLALALLRDGDAAQTSAVSAEDTAKARHWLAKAAALGDEDARAKMGTIFPLV